MDAIRGTTEVVWEDGTSTVKKNFAYTCYHSVGQEINYEDLGDAFWGAAWGPVVTPKAPSTDPRFPHKCPKCGSEAYIGANLIDHRNEVGPDCQ